MEVMQMRYFLEVAESQHMTRSAKKLHIAQPALSQSVHRLEKELGVSLFVSKGRNIVLTEYGKYLYTQLKPMVDKLDSLPETLQRMANINNGIIHLSVLAASNLITEAIIEFESSHDDVNFQLLQNTQSDMFDIEISTEMFYRSNNDNKKDYFICPEKIFLAVPNNDKYKNISSVSLSDVENEGFISLLGSKQFRYICDKFCHQAGIIPYIIFESDSTDAVKNMIAANLGIGFWPEFTWGEIDNDKVKLLEINDPKCSRDIVIAASKEKLANPNVKEFYDFLKEYFQRKRGCHI
jgi:DNA-binding transcriptional LysR family regulator